MENNIFSVSSILGDLQKPATTENAIATLSTLNQIISSSKDVEFLYETGALRKIISLLKSDKKLAAVCLKILAKASKRNVKIRANLLKNNIFFLLAVQLKNETDFSKSCLVLYTALIVILVQDNYDAKSQLRISGCLSCLVHILDCILDEAESKSPPFKNTELIIYSIIASIKNPRHLENQTEVGWITPKVVEYLRRQTVLSNDRQLRLTNCFWSLLKCLLDNNDTNQKIFSKSCGLIILFRSLQCIVEEKKFEEMAHLLIKLTSLLVKLKSQKEFLYQAYNYCSMMLLCNLLKTNNSLVIHHTIVFLDSLTQEIPQALYILQDKEILLWVRRAKIILSKGATTETLCQDILNRTGILSETESASQEEILSVDENLKKILNEDPASEEIKSLQSLQNGYCVLHDFQLSPSSLLDSPKESVWMRENGKKNGNFSKIKSSASHSNFHRNELKYKEKKLRRLLKKNGVRMLEENKTNINIIRRVGGGIFRAVLKVWDYFFSTHHNESNAEFFHDFLFSNDDEFLEY